MNNNTKSPRRILAVGLASSLMIAGLALSTQLVGAAKTQDVRSTLAVALLTPSVAPMTRTAPLAGDEGKEATLIGEDDGVQAKHADEDRTGVSEHTHNKPAGEKPVVSPKPAVKVMHEDAGGHSARVRLTNVTTSNTKPAVELKPVAEMKIVAPSAETSAPSLTSDESQLANETKVEAQETTKAPEARRQPVQEGTNSAAIPESKVEEINEVTQSVVAEQSSQVDCYEEQKGKNTYQVARTVIKATPADVFEVLTDYSKVDAIFDNLTRCEVVEDNGIAKKVAFTAKSMGGLWKFDYVLELKETAPYLIEWHRVSGAFKVNEGYWKLEPVNGGKYTQVTYSKFIDGGFLMPQKLVQKELKAIAPGVLKNLRTAAERHSVAAK